MTYFCKLMLGVLVIYSTFLSMRCQAANLVIQTSEVNFLAIGKPGALKIIGRSNDHQALKNSFSLTGSMMTGTSTFKLDSLSTGIELRDKHMKQKYLEIEKYPLAEFQLTKLTLPSGLNGDNIPFEGTLRLHGIEKAVVGKVTSQKTDQHLNMNYEFIIHTDKFSIDVPNFMGVSMGEEVKISVKLVAAIEP